jgi:hypothetical protein
VEVDYGREEGSVAPGSHSEAQFFLQIFLGGRLVVLRGHRFDYSRLSPAGLRVQVYWQLVVTHSRLTDLPHSFALEPIVDLDWLF